MGTETLVITFWHGVPPDQATCERYREIADAGFTVAQVSGRRDQIARQLDWCQQVGITGMVIDSRIARGDLLSVGRWRQLVQDVVEDYAWHPALWGYFVLDEPSASQFAALGETVAALREADPHHPTYINLFPNYANQQQLGTKTYEEHVRRYVKEVKPPLVSYDHYALMDNGNDRPEYFPNLEVVRQVSLEAGLHFWQIVLALPCLCYRNPTEADLRWQVWTTLAYGAKGISYFTYWTPDSDNFRNAIVDPFGERTEHYAQIRLINREIGRLGPILMKLRSVGIYHSPTPFNGLQPAPSDAPPRYVVGTNDEPITIGEFDDEDRKAYLIVVNRRLDRSIAARFVVKGGFRRMHQISRVTGRPRQSADLKPVKNGGEGTLWLAPGDGMLVTVEA